MPTIDDIYGGNYMAAKDVPEGKTMDVIATSITVRTAKEGEKPKLVATLNIGKDLAINKTNAKRLATKFGNDYTQWVGKSFKLVRSFTTYSGEEVACIRVVAE
jgi:hypothetical protein